MHACAHWEDTREGQVCERGKKLEKVWEGQTYYTLCGIKQRIYTYTFTN